MEIVIYHFRIMIKTQIVSHILTASYSVAPLNRTKTNRRFAENCSFQLQGIRKSTRLKIHVSHSLRIADCVHSTRQSLAVIKCKNKETVLQGVTDRQLEAEEKLCNGGKT
jgi:hypothetical protein